MMGGTWDEKPRARLLAGWRISLRPLSVANVGRWISSTSEIRNLNWGSSN
uniref:Uncharacterized protein n=1 Tax=Arundo donax TaxID=35708 RepID=A0A0A8YET8_ARUDO